MRFCVGQVKKVRKPAVSLGRDRGRLVAEAGIDGQVFPDTDIVLNVRAVVSDEPFLQPAVERHRPRSRERMPHVDDYSFTFIAIFLLRT